MNPDLFQDLYKMLRGSRAANDVLDAKALFMENKLSLAQSKIVSAREAYSDARARLLKLPAEKQVNAKSKDADRQIKKVIRKQEKAQEALEAFDEMLPQLAKLIERDERRREREQARDAEQQAAVERQAKRTEAASENAIAEEPVDGSRDATGTAGEDIASPPASIKDLHDDVREALVAADDDQRLDIINHHFGFCEVKSEADLRGETLYYLRTDQVGTLVRSPSADELAESVQFEDLVSGRHLSSYTRSAFVKLGSDRKIVLLTVHPESQQAETSMHEATVHDEDHETTIDEGQSDQNVLDLGAFSQLLSSAQRSGLVPGADQIGFVRDREFRLGKFDLAFQAIDQMFSRFMASAGQRVQQLAREDADISAGRLKLSPKDLQAKRARDRSQTQEVDRAKRRFQVVVEGLRVLMNNMPAT